MKDFSQSSTAKLPHSPLFSRLSLQRARCPCLSPGGSPAQLTCVSLRLLTWLPLPLTPISSHPLCNLSSKNLQQLYKRSLNSIAWQPARVLVAQLCLTLWDLMDYSRQEYWSGLPFPSPGDRPNFSIFPMRLNPSLPHCRQILYHLSHQGSPAWEPSLTQSSEEGSRGPWHFELPLGRRELLGNDYGDF